MNSKQHIFGITGTKDSGKTTLVSELICYFKGQGLRVSTVKHAHCSFDVDHPGRDSYRHREAGAQEVLVASDLRWALIHEVESKEKPDLETLLQKLAPADLVLVEGFKSMNYHKLQVIRPAYNPELLTNHVKNIVAIATDKPLENTELPQLDLNDIPAIGKFILQHCQITLP